MSRPNCDMPYCKHVVEEEGTCSLKFCSDCLAALRATGPHLSPPLPPAPVPIRLTCPVCTVLHLDVGEFATRPHHTHACQACGHVWRPAVVCTVGVRFLPGFRDEGEI